MLMIPFHDMRWIFHKEDPMGIFHLIPKQYPQGCQITDSQIQDTRYKNVYLVV